MRKGEEARLSFMGHVLMENDNGLLMDFVVELAQQHQRGTHPLSWRYYRGPSDKDLPRSCWSDW